MFFCFAGNDALVRIFLGTPQQLDLYQQTARLQPAASATSDYWRFSTGVLSNF